MAVLNDSSESLSTAVWGSRFQSTKVRGKNEAFLCCVLNSGTWYDRECMFLECPRGGESLSLLVTATLSWEILYIMTRHASQTLRRSSRLHHLRCCSMSPTLDVLRCLLVTYLTALNDVSFYLSEISFKLLQNISITLSLNNITNLL
jgi:hypothetical protein